MRLPGWSRVKAAAGRALGALALVTAIVALPQAAKAEDVVIVVGKSKTYPIGFTPGGGSNSNPEVLQAAVEGTRITFFGRKVGSATYIVFDQRSRSHTIQYEIRVVSEDLGRLRDDIARQIGDIEGVEVSVKGDQVIVEGDVATEGELSRVTKVTDKRASVSNLVRLSPIAIKALARTIEQNVNRPEVTARPLKEKIILEGIVYSQEQKTRAEAIATSIYDKIVDVIEIQQVQRPPSRAKTIVLNTHFLELSKQLLDTWSVDWATLALQGGAVSGFFQQQLVNGELVGDFNTTISGTVTAFLPKLDRAKPEGIIRTLANPVITVKDGSEAKVFTGSQVPFVIGETPTGIPIVEFKKVGIDVTTTPYAQGDSVDLKISIHVSDLGDVTLGNSRQSTGILESSFETSQFTRAGESVAIGGLFRVSDNILYNKRRPDQNPLAQDSIFQFFLAKEYTKRKSQFIVFITPSVYDDSVSANREMKDLFNLQDVGQ